MHRCECYFLHLAKTEPTFTPQRKNWIFFNICGHIDFASTNTGGCCYIKAGLFYKKLTIF